MDATPHEPPKVATPPPAMDVRPPKVAEAPPLPSAPQKPEAPRNPAKHVTRIAARQPYPGLGAVIFATIVIVFGLAILMVYAYLRTNGMSIL